MRYYITQKQKIQVFSSKLSKKFINRAVLRILLTMIKHKWILSAASVTAGVVNGFIGTGGGI